MPDLPSSARIRREKLRAQERAERSAPKAIQSVVSSTFDNAGCQHSNYQNGLNAYLADLADVRAYADSLPTNKRKQLEREAAGSYTFDEWYALCVQYEFRCLRCGKNDIKLTVDHVVPLSQGGSHSIENLQPLYREPATTLWPLQLQQGDKARRLPPEMLDSVFHRCCYSPAFPFGKAGHCFESLVYQRPAIL